MYTLLSDIYCLHELRCDTSLYHSFMNDKSTSVCCGVCILHVFVLALKHDWAGLSVCQCVSEFDFGPFITRINSVHHCFLPASSM